MNDCCSRVFRFILKDKSVSKLPKFGAIVQFVENLLSPTKSQMS